MRLRGYFVRWSEVSSAFHAREFETRPICLRRIERNHNESNGSVRFMLKTGSPVQAKEWPLYSRYLNSIDF